MSSYNKLRENLHPDIAGQPEFERMASQILAKRKKAREEARDPKKQRERQIVDFHSKSKIRKEEVAQESCDCDDAPELRSRTISDGPRTSSSSERRSRKSPGELLRALNQDSPKPKKKKKSKIQEAAPLLATLGRAAMAGGKSAGIRGAIGSATKEYGKEKLRDVVSNALNRTQEPKTASDTGTQSSSEKIIPGDTTTSAYKKAISNIIGMREEAMTTSDKKKEAALKKKYDDSNMKQNMIDQYGKERGTQIYFAKIRKLAMQEEFVDPEEGETPSGRRPIDKVAEHPNPRVRRKAVRGMIKQMEKNYGGKWKSSSKDPALDEEVSKPPKMSKEERKRQALIQKLERMIKASKLPKSMSDVAKEDMSYNEYLDEAKLSRTARRASRIGKKGYDEQGRRKPRGKVRAWDMDETLMRNDPKKIRVHVKDKATGKTIRSLTNQEFNTDKLNKDKEEYDFTEFRSSQKFKEASKPNKSMVKKLKKQVRRGKPVHIVTARGSFDDQPKFAAHLRKHGIEIDPGKGKGGRHVHVHRAGDMPGSDIGKKKVDIVKGLMKKHGSSGAEMYDDAAKVHRAFKKSNKETPTTQQVKTKMVMPNKKDVTQARSFKEEIDMELIYNFLLEQLILEEIAEDYDEAMSILENLDDELLEEFVLEGYEFIQSVLEEENEMESPSSKINYISPYKKLQEKREIFEAYTNVETVTPYEYWKSFIGYEGEDEIVNENVEDNYEEVERDEELTSYEYWKKRIEEQAVGREAMIAANIARAKAAKSKRAAQPTVSLAPAPKPAETTPQPSSSTPLVVSLSPNNKPKAQTGASAFAGDPPPTREKTLF